MQPRETLPPPKPLTSRIVIPPSPLGVPVPHYTRFSMASLKPYRGHTLGFSLVSVKATLGLQFPIEVAFHQTFLVRSLLYFSELVSTLLDFSAL